MSLDSVEVARPPRAAKDAAKSLTDGGPLGKTWSPKPAPSK
ncbi:hypothetical protein MAXJ12_07267 [Mesorhizobium alhagi CCNWXJ12-2]|uniref:Uncharacterized protein n=1 Tax=Mesorhizobium alhagi CCNWXJ12-2 TaxID=1107882 RepID=H0HMT9_9HYPH|nr:hypothetical protein MAXJ12_07267 [Mesorhizobium alhagi CCNWXJ12-2]